MRSVTESKNAPRTDAVPAALATGPSSRSCIPVMIRNTTARCRWPVATRTAVAVADTEADASQNVSGDAMAVKCLADRTGGPVDGGSPATVEHEAPRRARPGTGFRRCRREFTIRSPKLGALPTTSHGRWRCRSSLRPCPETPRTPGPGRDQGRRINPRRHPYRTHHADIRQVTAEQTTIAEDRMHFIRHAALGALTAAGASPVAEVLTAGPAGAATGTSTVEARRDRLPRRAVDEDVHGRPVRPCGPEQVPGVRRARGHGTADLRCDVEEHPAPTAAAAGGGSKSAGNTISTSGTSSGSGTSSRSNGGGGWAAL